MKEVLLSVVPFMKIHLLFNIEILYNSNFFINIFDF